MGWGTVIGFVGFGMRSCISQETYRQISTFYIYIWPPCTQYDLSSYVINHLGYNTRIPYSPMESLRPKNLWRHISVRDLSRLRHYTRVLRVITSSPSFQIFSISADLDTGLPNSVHTRNILYVCMWTKVQSGRISRYQTDYLRRKYGMCIFYSCRTDL